MTTDLKALREDAGLTSQEAAAKRVGVSLSTWSRWERGIKAPDPAAVELLRRIARGEPEPEAGDVVRVPILGRIPAGPLNLAVETVLGWREVDRSLVRPGDRVFFLKAQGQSMESRRIFDGDLVLIRQQDTAEPGEIVAAEIDGDTTLKRLRFRNGYPYLEGDQEPIYPTDPAALRILGVAYHKQTDTL